MVDEILVGIVTVNWCLRSEERNKTVPEIHLAHILLTAKSSMIH
jgi:hypothetical protein